MHKTIWVSACLFLLLGGDAVFASTYDVTNTTGDSTTSGDLGWALGQSSSSSSADNIIFTIGTGLTISQTVNYPSVTKTTGGLAITGNNDTVNGGGNSIFNFTGGGSFSVSGLNLNNGTITLDSGNYGTSLTLSSLTATAGITSSAVGTVATNTRVSWA